MDKLFELSLESLVLLDPLGVEVETERGSVGGEVTVEVVFQHPGELVRVHDVGAGGHQVAAWHQTCERCLTTFDVVQYSDLELTSTLPDEWCG